MSQIAAMRHFLVLPDGTTQELERGLTAEAGDLLAPSALGTTVEPDRKYVIDKVVTLDTGEWPRERRYYVTFF